MRLGHRPVADEILWYSLGDRRMKDYFYLIPIALGIGLTALAAFMWSLKNGQYDDLEGAAERILLQEDDAPIRRDIPTVRR
jgi:cbb3-type cytochrome oxidase maturation protein